MNIELFCNLNLQQLQQYKHPQKDLLYERVKDRLDESYRSYEAELNKGLQYLSRRDELKLAKKINRINKQNAKSHK